MTSGKHSRAKPRRSRQIRAAIGGFVVVAICAGGIAAAVTRHDDTDTTARAATTTTVRRRATTTARAMTSPASSTTADATTTAPTTTTATSAFGATALRGKIIVVDPGHNGGNSAHSAEINQLVPAGGFMKACDTSGTETNDGYTEHAFTWDVSNRLAADLRARGATVFLTRPDDNGVGPCVNVRGASGGDHDANLAISIHGDGGPADGRGFHVLPPGGCSGCDNAIDAPSMVFATLLRDTVRAETPMPVSTYAGQDGIFPRTDLGGLNLSTVPKVFIECGNMRNATDAGLMKDPTFRQQMADAIADAMTRYLDPK
ncbi:MAG: N-acetylmuramoyl-L-alanine amidase [Actinobacteria bacterium]|nr:N-acetylmuramoyl-L-alanine amidase [Actinomycetota bacterium]